MRFLFKTGYEQDLRLAKHDGHRFWYGLLGLLLLAAPWLLSEYLLAQLTFILIYSVVGLGLMMLAGFTGLFSIGHAAFLGVGAYTQAVLTNMGFIGLKAFPAAVVGGFTSLPGAIVGGIIIGVVESLAGFYLPEGFKDIAAYVVVLIMLMVKPNGLFGERLRKKV